MLNWKRPQKARLELCPLGRLGLLGYVGILMQLGDPIDSGHTVRLCGPRESVYGRLPAWYEKSRALV